MKQDRPLAAGFRWSTYGPDYDPGPEYWGRVGLDMARKFEGAVPETLWIVSRMRGQGRGEDSPRVIEARAMQPPRHRSPGGMRDS